MNEEEYELGLTYLTSDQSEYYEKQQRNFTSNEKNSYLNSTIIDGRWILSTLNNVKLTSSRPPAAVEWRFSDFKGDILWRGEDWLLIGTAFLKSTTGGTNTLNWSIVYSKSNDVLKCSFGPLRQDFINVTDIDSPVTIGYNQPENKVAVVCLKQIPFGRWFVRNSSFVKVNL
jgi:hypothetical protein